MQTIDFLPNRYRERSAVQRIKVWQLGVVCLYGFAILAAIVGQRIIRERLQARVDLINFEYSAAEANEKLLRQIQLELNRRRASANLYAFLQHRWPQTQILRAVASVQPDSVHLQQLNITPGGEDGVGGRRNAFRGFEKQEDEKEAPAPLADLKALREREQSSQLKVWLVGETSNTPELHKFVADLAQPRVLAKAELVSLDAVADPRRVGVFEFTIKVMVQSTYDLSTPHRVSNRVAIGAHHD